MQNKNQWTLLQNPIIFYITADTTQLSLADLPPQTRKAKLYLCLQSGGCCNEEKIKILIQVLLKNIQFVIFYTWSFVTKVDFHKISRKPHWQNIQNIYTETCNIRLDERKIIEVSRSGSFPSENFSLIVQVQGYK
ncbi:unnamed protein product [Paramecium primaurelia]|uniref:Uncharacterized protein n=1 Tax=Paramecium primaurelia TaxID=5886 RepID=A0A8S1NFN9_PARPR|nr:unnamed protein product [Paramecium primaurelia]